MHVDCRGTGPGLVLVHGSATDADTWIAQRSRLEDRLRVISYDRRGTPRSPLGAGVTSYSVAEHARDAAELITSRAGAPVIACGSSFGGVCVLELARQRPDLVRGIILCEPPLAPPGQSLIPKKQAAELDRMVREGAGPQAAEYFLRVVLGPGFDRLPQSVRQRCLALHAQIALDHAALVEYRIDDDALAGIEVPARLVGGAQSQAFFRPTLEWLARTLPRAELRVLAGGSHMMHVDAAAGFAGEVLRFARAIGHLAGS